MSEVPIVSRRRYGRYATREAYERSLAASREAKARRRGTCRQCGGETRYNGHGKGVSDICETCNNRPHTHCNRGHELTPEVDLRGTGNKWACRICRNDYMRDYMHRQRRARGVPERDPDLYESRRLKLSA